MIQGTCQRTPNSLLDCMGIWSISYGFVNNTLQDRTGASANNVVLVGERPRRPVGCKNRLTSRHWLHGRTLSALSKFGTETMHADPACDRYVGCKLPSWTLVSSLDSLNSLFTFHDDYKFVSKLELCWQTRCIIPTQQADLICSQIVKINGPNSMIHKEQLCRR